MRRLLVVGLLLGVVAPVWAETMYARFSTPVRSGRGLTASTIGTLQQGRAVTVQEREGSYYRVSFSGKTGYVYYNKLSAEKPEDISSLLAGGPGSEGLELSELEAGGALRGLSPMAENYAAGGEVPEWAVQAVEAMQGRRITPRELEEFQREGGLGEYGGEATP